MTEQGARALVARLFGLIDGAHFDDLGRVFADDAVYERPGYEPLRGLSRIEQFYRHERVIASGQHHVETVTCSAAATSALESHVVAVGVFRGKGRDGQPLEERFADVYQVQGDHIIRRTTFFFRPAI